MKFSSYFALAASFLTSAHALIGSSWSVTNVPSSGLTDITFPITMIIADHISGYYFAQQFSFVGLNGNNVGYTGIQPRPDSNGLPVLHGIFSSFVSGSTTTDANAMMTPTVAPTVAPGCHAVWNGTAFMATSTTSRSRPLGTGSGLAPWSIALRETASTAAATPSPPALVESKAARLGSSSGTPGTVSSLQTTVRTSHTSKPFLETQQRHMRDLLGCRV